MFEPVPGEEELPPEIVYLVRHNFFCNMDEPFTPEQTRLMVRSRAMASENDRYPEYWKFYEQKIHEALGRMDCPN